MVRRIRSVTLLPVTEAQAAAKSPSRSGVGSGNLRRASRIASRSVLSGRRRIADSLFVMERATATSYAHRARVSTRTRVTTEVDSVAWAVRRCQPSADVEPDAMGRTRHGGGAAGAPDQSHSVCPTALGRGAAPARTGATLARGPAAGFGATAIAARYLSAQEGLTRASCSTWPIRAREQPRMVATSSWRRPRRRRASLRVLPFTSVPSNQRPGLQNASCGPGRRLRVVVGSPRPSAPLPTRLTLRIMYPCQHIAQGHPACARRERGVAVASQQNLADALSFRDCLALGHPRRRAGSRP